jgi:type II secretory pathway pseudopilin PulG
MHMRTWKSEHGMSLVEATIILMVLAILTSVLAPSIGDYVNDARQVKAKEDLEVLGLSVARLVRDTGLPFPVRVAGAAPSKASTNRVDLLVSEGQLPTITAGTGVAAAAAGYLIENAVDWNDPIGAEVELATDHLITNVNGYTVVTFPAPAGPVPGLGWRGGYLSNLTGPDPWGVRYACATVWLNPSSDVVVAANRGTNNDAFCLSAGADGNVDTDIESSVNGGVAVGGDDAIYVIQGTTR